MAPVTFRRCGGAVQLQANASGPSPVRCSQPTSPDDADWTWAPAPSTSSFAVCQLLRELIHEHDAAEQLRSLLVDADTHFTVSRMSDHDLIKAVAGLVTSHRVAMRMQVLTAQGLAKYAVKPLVHATYAAAEPATTPSLSRGSSPQETPAAMAASQDELARIDQDAQAATLRVAAARGVPFCEVCAA